MYSDIEQFEAYPLPNGDICVPNSTPEIVAKVIIFMYKIDFCIKIQCHQLGPDLDIFDQIGLDF